MNILEKNQGYKYRILQTLNLFDNVFSKEGWGVVETEDSFKITNERHGNTRQGNEFCNILKGADEVLLFQHNCKAFILWHTMFEVESCERKLRRLLQVAAADYTPERVRIEKENGHRIFKVLVDHEMTAKGYMNFLALYAQKIIKEYDMKMETDENGCCVKILKEVSANGGHWGWLKRFNHSMREVTEHTLLNGNVGVELFPGEIIENGFLVHREVGVNDRNVISI